MARLRYTDQQRMPPEKLVEYMESQGRRAFQTNAGTVFGSVPGASRSRFDTQSGLGIGGEIGTIAHDNAWREFFGPLKGSATAQVTPSAPMSAGVAADENFGGGTPTGAPAVQADPVSASIQSNQNWMQSNGFSFPPPPTPRAPLYNTQTRQIPAPNLNADPARFKSKFVNSGSAADPGYIASVKQFNDSLYQPADTKPSFYQNQTAPASSGGWVTTAPAQLDAIRQRYGPSSNG